jgi:hypothetical protein
MRAGRFIGSFILVLAVAWSAVGQDETVDSEVSAGLDLERLSWLAGQWHGEAFGGTCEETWTPPSGGSMVGTYKHMVDGRAAFYEIIIISTDSLGAALNLRHFNPDLTGWEEKGEAMRFPFVDQGDSELRFDGLSYERVTDDSLIITVSVKGKDGTPREEVIRCVRAGN